MPFKVLDDAATKSRFENNFMENPGLTKQHGNLSVIIGRVRLQLTDRGKNGRKNPNYR
jgi:hypothetical protein